MVGRGGGRGAGGDGRGVGVGGGGVGGGGVGWGKQLLTEQWELLDTEAARFVSVIQFSFTMLRC